MAYYSHKTETRTLSSKDHYVLVLICHNITKTVICETFLTPLTLFVLGVGEFAPFLVIFI